ncbi:tryptophan 2,3-dioxygenase family protein [Flavobacterium sp. I3-2]|uniref:tryptophan 2,3-dioxygenase family protein n=1 Tax=Flavobacterium sp. I3-2 TaxID=2748319 RepID=UPI0015AB3388|nr:tryptophan 2,3-dioxygenase family protein [Flavobacterium sp. I3-2]
MEITTRTQEKLDALDQKFKAIDQKIDTHLEGLLWQKPITYWDYIQTDALLNLQIQRSTLPDEMVFIMYHQVNELLFKMILWEMEQICHNENITTTFFTERMDRITRYFDMLTTSFDIMGDGMEVQQYLKFRNTLTPASGFQSAQYRLIEFASTDLINLIDVRYRENIDRNTPYEHAFEHLYWQAAGKDYKTGKKSYLINEFERKYKKEFIEFMEKYNTINLWRIFKKLPEADQQNQELRVAMRHYDKTVNITWVMGHFNAAKKYIESESGPQEATGGSDWKKYMLPQYQRRIFFPELWTQEELDNWGKDCM